MVPNLKSRSGLTYLSLNDVTNNFLGMSFTIITNSTRCYYIVLSTALSASVWWNWLIKSAYLSRYPGSSDLRTRNSLETQGNFSATPHAPHAPCYCWLHKYFKNHVKWWFIVPSACRRTIIPFISQISNRVILLSLLKSPVIKLASESSCAS